MARSIIAHASFMTGSSRFLHFSMVSSDVEAGDVTRSRGRDKPNITRAVDECRVMLDVAQVDASISVDAADTQ